MVRFLIPATASALLALSAQTFAAPPTTDPALTPDSNRVYRDARKDGGPGKDGIPSIDRPRFQDPAAADRHLDDGDRVIGLYLDGEARAYPQEILVWHEIVNDEVAGRGIGVTYCPLTGTAVGFDLGSAKRQPTERRPTELGVSGKLLNSNVVLYDRDTGSEYSQILGAGIDGPNEGRGLAEVRLFWTTWGQWKTRHPDTRVLSRRTGALRNYGSDPYGSYNPREGYYAPESRSIFPVLHRDGRYSPKYEILGFRDRHQAVAVDPEHLREAGVVEHQGPGGHYLVIHDPGLDTGWVYRGEADVDPGRIRFTPAGPQFPGRDELEEVNAFEAMWFSWAGFYPDTVVIDHAEP